MHSYIFSIVFVALVFFSSCVTGRVVQWTAAGGNPLWDSPNNWDSFAVPTADDDVIINVANIAGNVRIGSGTATCKSLTVGGNSATAQSLTIFTGLNIGSGGASILPNGQVTLNAAPSTPLTTTGTFTGNSKFTFISGTLGGSGSFIFANVPFNGTALKVINTTVTVTGVLDVSPYTGPAVINIATQALVVKGTISSSATVTLASAKGASFQVPGTLSYQGGQTDSFTILGDATIASMMVTSGTIILNDNVTVSSTTLTAGATVNVIGPATSIRKFGDVTGQGIVNIQGGTNSFSSLTSVGTVQLSGGALIANNKASTISTLVQTGGQIQGGAGLSIGSATLTNAGIVSTPITASTLRIHGFSQISASALTVTASGVIEIDSQFTLSNGASFVVAPTAQVTQSGQFQILPSGSTVASTFSHNGRWTSSTSDLKVLVGTNGNGQFQFGSGASMEITGVTFLTGSISMTSASLTSVASYITVGSISGTGTIQSNGQTLVVTDSFQASSVTVQNGFASAGKPSITSFDLQFGTFNITGTAGSIGTLLFEGGSIGGAASGSTVLTVDSLTVTGTQPKTLASLSTVFTSLNMNCDVAQCQLFTSKAKLSSKSS
eukprot:TRINITY_DN14_c0_g1_i3.p1 TRINITY_DN14_c0_g1~~TRINITY_DN14_c0_g1_i3.p1  ORF type:complete len:608 (-),score=166.98 TRINITY_DN14_c0_g1_i3:185-2008(-)